MSKYDIDLDDVAEGFAIRDESSAAWAVNKVRSFDEQIARIREQSATMIESIEKERARFSDFVTPHLEVYFESNAPKKGRSIKLVSGTIGYRKVAGGPRIKDAAACVEWARQYHPDAIATVVNESVPAAFVKAHVERTGEVPDGVDLVEDRDCFYIK